MLNRVQRVVIAVSDLEAAEVLYGGTFGLKGTPVEDFPELGARRLRFDVGNAFIDIAQPVTDSGPLFQFIKDRGEGLYLMVVQVEDLNGTVAALIARGADIVRHGGRTFISPKTTHGALMELLE